MSIPETFRPREFFQIKNFPDHVSMAVAVRIRFHYESIVIALSRITLHLEGETSTTRRSASKNRLIHAARTVIELTRYIDTEAHAPIWYVNCALVSTFSVFDENMMSDYSQCHRFYAAFCSLHPFRLRYTQSNSPRNKKQLIPPRHCGWLLLSPRIYI